MSDTDKISIAEFQAKWGNLSEFKPEDLSKLDLCQFIAEFAFVPEWRDEALDTISQALIAATDH